MPAQAGHFFRYPSVDWVLWTQTRGGPFVRCQACGTEMLLRAGQSIDAFADAHREHVSPVATHYGAGDLVARATGALGAKPCTPCEARRQKMNTWFPKLWKR